MGAISPCYDSRSQKEEKDFYLGKNSANEKLPAFPSVKSVCLIYTYLSDVIEI